MIDVTNFSPQTVKKAYNRRSWLYSKTVAPAEYSYHLKALSKAQIQANEKVLEVAVGPGMTLLEIIKQVEPENTVFGVDISSEMLKMTQERLLNAGYTNFSLREADARRLDFEDKTFDLIYNGYMLDLIPLNDMKLVLREFYRILKPGGRMVLLNMSKPDENPTLREKLFGILPPILSLYIAGGCRPVLMASYATEIGFRNVTREFVDGVAPSEIVIGTK